MMSDENKLNDEKNVEEKSEYNIETSEEMTFENNEQEKAKSFIKYGV